MICARLRAGLALSFVAVLLFGAACKRNHPPSVPDVTGRLTYRPGDTVRLSAAATDLDDDSLAYLFVWVDSSSAVWSEIYPNGAAATASHAYAASDTYTVRVRSRDTKDAESDWSPAETVRVGIFAPGVPACPAGPTSGATGDTYRCSTRATSPYGEPVLIEYDWNGTQGGWRPAVPSDSPCVGTHVFRLPGTYHIRARAGDTTGLYSVWSDSLAVRVVLQDTTPPSVRIVSPADSDWVKRGLIVVKAVASDDQVLTRVKFTIDGTLVSTDSIGVGDTFSCAWTDTVAQVPDQNHTIVATAFDAGGNSSSSTIVITVVRSGVKWYWWSDNLGAMDGSAVVASDGVDEVVMSYCWGDWLFYTIKASSGSAKSSTSPQWCNWDFSGHPALCAATGHVIIGSEEGELYGFTLPNLSRAWRWPDMPAESLEPFTRFGAPAINGNVIYVGRDDDSLYKFTDAGSSIIRGPVYGLNGATVVDAPAIGADGSVYFSTDSGYLIKIDANLTAPIWRKHLIPVGEISGPVIGSDGTVYCAADSPFVLYAVGSDGVTKWTATLDGYGARPAIGQSALFVGTDMGTVYSINPQTGSINWQRPFTPGTSFYTTPIVAANGYLYIQDDNDVLYCLNQTDGTKIWSCDCDSYLPGRGRSRTSARPRKLELTNYAPNPSITAEGDIIVVGWQALFCVSGYRNSPLDPAAAWPKWQKNLFNTGR